MRGLVFGLGLAAVVGAAWACGGPNPVVYPCCPGQKYHACPDVSTFDLCERTADPSSCTRDQTKDYECLIDLGADM